MITPLLSMSLPDPNSTPGPDWGYQINNAFLRLDSILGPGTTPSQMNINQDLDFQGNDAVNLRSTRFVNFTSSLSAPADIGCEYLLNGNLWVTDISGNQIQLTNNGAINTSPGNIGGLTGTSASLSFNAVSNAFTFNASPTTLANVNGASASFTFLNVSGTVQAFQANFTSASYGNIQNLTGSLVQATTVSGGTGNFTNLNASVSSLGAVTGTTFTGSQISVAQLTASGGKITTVNATSVTATTVSTTNLTSSGGSFSSTVTAPTVNTTTFTATNGTITTLTSSGGTLGPIQTSTVNASSTVTAPNATLTNITSTGTTSLQNANVTGTLYVGGTSTQQQINCQGLNATGSAALLSNVTVGANKLVINPASTTQMLSSSGDIVAQGGFRQQLGPASFYSSTGISATTNMETMTAAASAVSNVFYWVAPMSGSVVAMSALAYAGPGNKNLTFTLNINNSPIAGCSCTAVNIASNTTAYAYFGKDVYPFNPGDIISTTVTPNASFSTGFSCCSFLTVEC